MILPRFYPILDTATLARRGLEVESAAEALLDGGARILQFRHKGHFTRTVFAQAAAVAARCREAGAIFLLNDRADIAMLVAAGLHVGQEDLAPSDARRLIGSEPVLGFSTHNAAQAVAADAEPADYLAIGPVFATASKDDPDPAVGIAEVRRARLLTSKPLVAIGGITRSAAVAVLEAGADSVAVIGDLYSGPESLRTRTEEWIKLTR